MTQRAHPDRLLPADPTTRAVARELFETVRTLPITSPHGHVPVQWLTENTPFRDATELLITPDHYVTRLLHANGVALSELGVGVRDMTEPQARRAFKLLAEYWPAFQGTPMRTWMEDELGNIFGIQRALTESSADDVFDEVTALLATPEFRPRELLARFNVDVLATTDDPLADLGGHAALAIDPEITARVLPTFRPDSLVDPSSQAWREDVRRLGELVGISTDTIAGFNAAMWERRSQFIAHGGTAADHSHADAMAVGLEDAEAGQLFDLAIRGDAKPDQRVALRKHLVFEQARQSAEDGLVMTIHPSIRRDYDPHTRDRYGSNVGADIPLRGEFVEALRPVLNEFGHSPNFRLVAFTTDETVFSTELAPLAGFYPSLFVGAPWWFIDAPSAISRYYSAVTPNAGFKKLSGFIDDTRALCSIPARHDMHRRVTAGYLAGMVVEHQITLDEAADTIHGIIHEQPRYVFGL